MQDLQLTEEFFSVSRAQKEAVNGHPSFVIWLTGLSASGKSTIARKLEKELFDRKIRTVVLDGDNTRIGINKDLDFSDEGRKENIRRVAEISKLMNDAGVVVISSFISPFQSDRLLAKSIIGQNSFIEVFIDANIQTCIDRDPKGLYALAKAGKIEHFTGISSPYESPENPDLQLDTNLLSIHDSVVKILDFLAIKFKLN
ncbi:adenylyl-sulfate kinase [Pedobacter changchengzhani]|uniref:Adenylyl-sulfate kinase n=1 Tax=Pedobacter changchengzhani TaxID=2529274 RepID=A0A4R5MPE4_9SPHI|nr:adenylyl-sulfate kinase [Pedobacter changchengzhani]TDG37682.1 adenylyl-sulfate kinase [Pedobacter changchengzhani]